MTEFVDTLFQIESSDLSAGEHFLPSVVDELRKLASVKLAQERPAQTPQATARGCEGYIRITDVDKLWHWNWRGVFSAQQPYRFGGFSSRMRGGKAGPKQATCIGGAKCPT